MTDHAQALALHDREQEAADRQDAREMHARESLNNRLDFLRHIEWSASEDVLEALDSVVFGAWTGTVAMPESLRQRIVDALEPLVQEFCVAKAEEMADEAREDEARDEWLDRSMP